MRPTRPHLRPRTRPLTVAATLFLALATTAAPLTAQLDPTGDDGPLFDGRDAWIAGAYFATAALAFPFDEEIAVAIRDSSLQARTGLPQTATAFNLLGFPGSLLLSGGLWGAGRLTDRPELADAGLHMGEAIVVAEAVTYAIKLLAGRARPVLDIRDPFDFRFGRGIAREDDYRSFPSGHTSAAFAVAAAAAHELERIYDGNDWVIGALTYGPAAVVGLSRMFDNRHWTSDVVFGAAIGAFAGWKVVRYSHSRSGNPTDDWFLALRVPVGDWRGARLSFLPVPF